MRLGYATGITRIMKRTLMSSLQMSNQNSTGNYEATIDALNTLQSNADYVKNVRNRARANHANTTEKMAEFLIRSGMDLATLDTLSVIHVTGTKGKGSTCAYCESILRHHGIRTGFFSSPHLVNVTERIRINGTSVKNAVFSKHFWEIYNRLSSSKTDSSPYMPIYFEMLVLVAFRIFIEEKVNVAIVEVGIGGEYDSTNILRKVPVVGITSLGLDHTALLGNSLENIAWHKSGIMKKDSLAYTVTQKPEAMKILVERSMEKGCTLEVVNSDSNENITDSVTVPHNILRLNASLAVTLAKSWLSVSNTSIAFNPEWTRTALINCSWPGRYQVLRAKNLVLYLDGAHTEESLQYCLDWFREASAKSANKKALIFNNTGDRNSEDQLKILEQEYFSAVCFTPNVATTNQSADSLNFNTPENVQMKKCLKHKHIWTELIKSRGKEEHRRQEVILQPTIEDVLKILNNESYDVLVTGSLHLVGAVLSLVDPGLLNVDWNDENGKIRTKV